MRLIILLLLLVGTGIFIIQNQQPVVLYFLGTEAKTALFSLSLPLGLWVVIFAVAGIMTSLLIQLLTRSPEASLRRPSRQNPTPKSVKSPNRPRPPEPPETPYQRPEPKRSDWEMPPNPEWEANTQLDEDEEWNIEEPPKERTQPFQPSKTPIIEDQSSEFEMPQTPKTVSREGTIYSYTYRELRDRQDPIASPEPESPPSPPETPPTPPPKSEPINEVYDANYRVITPPYQTPPNSLNSDFDENEDEESWV
ncbi:LapA family protein [Crocosphaera sp. UHCC 0190]|uniref:LapA family protein n=1 Tax=Crocosphaera sp. UHCC 0190 TaxID=3110246 RepID=UPI002B2025B4|nr:LapA family protein [Crocosphaera sp. UHCC 0190]MEA5510891.1 LapA family protein [Crocosphaera sp. UHCC 0190]